MSRRWQPQAMAWSPRCAHPHRPRPRHRPPAAHCVPPGSLQSHEYSERPRKLLSDLQYTGKWQSARPGAARLPAHWILFRPATDVLGSDAVGFVLVLIFDISQDKWHVRVHADQQ